MKFFREFRLNRDLTLSYKGNPLWSPKEPLGRLLLGCFLVVGMLLVWSAMAGVWLLAVTSMFLVAVVGIPMAMVAEVYYKVCHWVRGA